MGIARNLRRLARKKQAIAAKKHRRKAVMEPLEPRLLLSADLSYTLGNNVKDVTLALHDVDGVDGFDTLQIINNDDVDPATQVVASIALSAITEDGGIEIKGSAYDDHLVMDFTNPFSIPVSFIDGSDTDSDVLEIVGNADQTWNITGPDVGYTENVDFAGIENLLGAADNEDTFIVQEGSSLSGTMDGGEGGFDTLVLDGGTYDSVIYNATGPDSGTIDRDGDVLTYAGLEPIADYTSATDRVFTTSNSDDRAKLTDNGTTLTLSPITGFPTFESITFNEPSNSLTINLGEDLGIPFLSKDVLTINSFDVHGVDLTVNGEDGTDEVVIAGAVAADDITINAEKITVSSTIDATNVTLSAAAEDDGAVDEYGLYLGGIFEGLYIATPEAAIDLTGANITATGDVTLSATATANLGSVNPSTLGSTLDASLLTILPTATITLDGTTLTAANLDADANVNVTVAFEDDADGSDTDTTSDAAATVLVLISESTMAVQGASDINLSGDAAFDAATTLDLNSTADGSGGAAGGTVAVTEVQADTIAFVTDSASILANTGDTPDSVTIGATLNSTVSTTSTSTAGGAESGGGTNESEERLADPNQDEDTSDQAQTSDGSVSFAGAVVVTDYRPVTEVYLDTDGTVISDNDITLTATAIDTVTSTADASNTGSGGTGVGVAVAIGVVDSQALAWIGGSGSLTADNVLLNATLDADNTYKVDATSGIGDSSDTGVAGALAINVVTTTVEAYVDQLSTVNLNGADLSLTANSQVKIETNAVPDEDAGTAESLGIGASVALTISDNQTHAAIDNGGAVTGAGNITLTSNADHDTTTKAVGGASGGTAVTPVVATSVILGDTSAFIGTDTGGITLLGNLGISATHDADTTTTAEGDAEGTSTALGASLALTIDEQTSAAELLRDATLTGGALALMATGKFRSRSSADAAASGAAQDDGVVGEGSDDDDGVNQQSQGQTDFANSQAESRTGSGSGTTTAPDASSSDGSMSVAAAISINIAENDVTATIADFTIVEADEAVSVGVASNQDSWAQADGSAANGDSATVGAAVALNVATLDAVATTGASMITADGLTVSSTMASREMDIDVSSEDIVLVDDDTIYVGEPEGLSTGEAVTYKNGGGTDIGGLTNNTTYYIIKANEGKIKLAETLGNANNGTAINLTSQGVGDAHVLERTGHDNITFDPDADHFPLSSNGTGSLRTGDQVVYGNGGGTDFGGLTNGKTYYAIVKDGSLSLATSREDAMNGKAVKITSVGTGTDHTLTEAEHRSAADATSGASGGNVGVAGALGINVMEARTTALLPNGATIEMIDGGDAYTDIGSILVNSASRTFAGVDAGAKQDGDTGEGVGVGASIGLNITDHATTALMETGAIIDSSVTDPGGLTLNADGANHMWTEAEGGAAGGTAVTPVVAISVAQNDVTAKIDAGDALTLGGDLNITATQANDTRTIAKGDAEGVDAAVGASLGLTVAEDTVSASLLRDLTTTGGISLLAQGVAASKTDAEAGAKGAEGDDGESGTADDTGVNDQTQSQLDHANAETADRTSSGTGTDTTETPDSSTSDGAVSVAAAIGVNIANGSSRAFIGGIAGTPINVDAQGGVAVISKANLDAAANADGSAVTTSGGTSVGAAVAVNVSDIQNHASIEYANVTGDGVVVEAVMADRSIDAPITSLPVVDTDKETIFLGLDAGLKTGDKVMYYNGGGDSIGGITSIGDLSSMDDLTASYYVNVGKDGTVKLYDTEEHAKTGGSEGLKDLTSTGSGTGHKFYKWIKISSYSAPNLFSPIEFDPAGNVRVLNLGTDSGLNTGDVVKYDPAGDTAITYLTTDDTPVTESLDGETDYYIIDLTGGRYQLAASRKDAFKGKAIKLTGDGNTDQQIVDRTSGSRALAKSGAGGGDYGVAGSVAVNVAGGATSAILGEGAVITAQDGTADGDSDIGASKVNAEANTYTFTQALPDETASGTSLGLGLSFAIGIGAHDADASILSGATVANAGDMTVSATGDHAMVTKAKAGAKSNGGTSVGGAVALSVANNNADALVDAGASLESSGDVIITASSSQVQSTEADADTKGGETGVGVAFAMGWVEDDTSAILNRDVSSGAATAGDVKVEATSDVDAKTVAKGSATGSKSEDAGGNSADDETQNQTNYANDRAGTDVNAPTPNSNEDRSTTGVDTGNTEARSQTSDPGGQGGTDQQGSSETEGGTVRAAAAIGATVVKPEVTATISNGLTIDADGDLSVKAINDADADTQATGIAFSGDASTAVGAAVAINVGLLDATATLGDGTTTAGSVSVEAGSTIDESNDFKVMAIAGGGSTQKSEGEGDGGGEGGGESSSNTAVAGAAGVNVIVANTSADIADGSTVTTLTDNVDVTARQDIRVQNVAGGAALTLSDEGTSVGAAIGVNYVDSTTTATIGDLAVVDSAGNVNVLADASIMPIEFTVPMVDYTIDKIQMTNLILGAAIGSGGDAGAGSAAINVFTPVTRATIGAGAYISADSDVTVKAIDDTKITDFAGALAGSKDAAGVGIGLDVTVVTKTTEALIAAYNDALLPTTIDAGGNVVVDADSSEDYFQLTANIGAGESTSGAGGLNVLVNVTDTRAIVGRDPAAEVAEIGNVEIDANGSVVVSADSTTLIESYAGTAGVSLSGSSVGISVGVLVDIDETSAIIGDDASITALGNGTAVPVRDGNFDEDGNQGTEDVRGLAVTATSFEDITLLAIAASGSLGQDNEGETNEDNDGGTTVGIAASVGVAVMHGQTKATVGDGAQINADSIGANENQGILIRGADETNLLTITGGLQIGLGADAGVTGSVTVNDIENFVWAKALGDNTLNASGGGITLDADAKVDILAVTIAAAGVVNTEDSGSEGNNQSGSISFTGAGSVTVDIVETEALAEIGAGSTVITSGDMSITADDNSVIQADSGGAAITIENNDGTTAGAVGASVGVNDITQTISATATDTTITSGNFSAIATNNAEITALTIAGSAAVSTSGGDAFGGAGSGSGNYVYSTTTAGVMNPSGQKVLDATGTITVEATDSSKIDADAGSGALAVSTGDGEGNSGDFGAIAVGAAAARNEITKTTTSELQNVDVTGESAPDTPITTDVSVTASSTGSINAFTLGIAGSYTDSGSLALSGAGSGSGNFINSTTTATIDPSVFDISGDMTVSATDSADITATAGAAAVSISVSDGDTNVGVGLGISVAVNDITSSALAIIDDTTVDAGGAVSVTAESTADIQALAFGVALSITTSSDSSAISVDGGVAVTLNEIDTTTCAAIEDSDTATVNTLTAGNAVTLSATDSGMIVADAISVAASIAIGGDSGSSISGSIAVSYAENSIESTAEATIDSMDTTAQGNVSLSASSSKVITAHDVAAAASISGGSGSDTSVALAGAGASSTNTTNNFVLAIINNADVIANDGGSVSLNATDSTVITADVVAAALSVGVSSEGNGGSLAVAVTVAENHITNTTRAVVEGASTITADGDFDAHASSTGSITAVGAAASLSVGVSGGTAGLTGAGAGVGATNTIENTIEAGVIGDSSVDVD
ncbi:LEPR-XLL domain-containing protein, partial [Thermodesulfobacteriota bacterium]